MSYALSTAVDQPFAETVGATRDALAGPSIGLLLPCNVVVRAIDEHQTVVEAMGPDIMITLTGNQELNDVAADDRDRLTRALAAVTSTATRRPPSTQTEPAKDDPWSLSTRPI